MIWRAVRLARALKRSSDKASSASPSATSQNPHDRGVVTVSAEDIRSIQMAWEAEDEARTLTLVPVDPGEHRLSDAAYSLKSMFDDVLLKHHQGWPDDDEWWEEP